MRSFIVLCLYFVIGSMATAMAHETFDKNLHAERLSFWRDKGFSPKVIYDVGAYRGFWSRELKQVFPSANFFLFEANGNNSSYLKETGFPFFIALLGDKEGEALFYSNDLTGDSIFCEQTKFYDKANCTARKLPITTLANVANSHALPLPDLVKFDVQGAEKLIIEGSRDLLQHAELLILETKVLEYNKGAPLAYEIISLIDSLGYTLLDVLECHYLPTGELNEIDFLFVKKGSKLIKTGLLIE
jgi:FkbM family methyltransferase